MRVANSARSAWIRSGFLVVCTACASVLPACVESYRPQRIRNWTIVIRDDSFLAYMSPASRKTGDAHSPLPVSEIPPNCQWQDICRLKQFVDDQLWLPTSVAILPVNFNEPFLETTRDLISRTKGPLVIASFEPLSAWGDAPEVEEYRDRLLAVEP